MKDKARRKRQPPSVPGISMDSKGNLQFDHQKLLRLVKLPDTPGNRKFVEQMARQSLDAPGTKTKKKIKEKRLVGARVIVTEDHPCTGHTGKCTSLKQTPLGAVAFVHLDQGDDCLVARNQIKRAERA